MRDPSQDLPMSGEPHGSDLRKGRFSCAGHVYLVTCVTHRRVNLFTNIYLARIVVRQLMRSEASGWVTSLAYVVMPDHLHWLFRLSCNVTLADVIGNVKRHSSREIRLASRESRAGIWQRGFHDRALRDEESLVVTARYIIANPIRAGLVERVGDYPLWDAVWF